MKSTKTKKLLGGVAIAAVSLGCLGLAGIANAAAGPQNGTGNTPAAPQPTGAYPIKNLAGTMTGSTTITANISQAQVKEGQSLKSHKLEYVQIGSYIGHGTSFSLSAPNQTVENALYGFLTASAQDGGLKEAFPSASYTSADGEALNWLLNGNNSNTFLGADASGQNGYGTAENADYAVRLLANYLYANSGSASSTPLSFTQVKWGSTATDQSGTFTVPNPGVYLIVDTTDSGNASLPIILSTKPSTGYTVPQSMTNYVTDTIALKSQDPQATPVKQFVKGAAANSSGDLTSGTLTGTMSATIGDAPANYVTYQISNVFPNTNGYQAYVYKFIDNPGMGLTLNIARGANMYVAGIPLTTLVNDGDATVTYTGATGSSMGSTPTVYGNGTGNTAIADMPNLIGGTGAQMTVSLNAAGMQYIAANGYQTSNVDGKSINFGKLSSQSTVSQTVNGTTSGNTMSGVNNGASSYTGQTKAAANGENGNSASADYPQAQGELFGLTYQAFLNSSVATHMNSADGTSTTSASNTAQTDNNGTESGTATSNPLTTSGTYNGGKTDNSGKPGPTTQNPPSPGPGTTHGVPNKYATGLSWMKIWGSGQVATGAEFWVQNSNKQYLYATGSGWGWTANKSDAQKFEAATLASGTNPAAEGGLFEIGGLADGTYTVTEAQAATGADPNVLPQFTITLKSNEPEVVNTSAASLNLVNNTPNGSPFNSVDYNTVENVKSLMGLPLTGGAGILTGVIAAVILFGTAGIVLVVYKRRKQQED